MVTQTGSAVLRINDDGKKFWSTSDNSSKDAFYMVPKEKLEFNPEVFEEGAEIRIYEPV